MVTALPDTLCILNGEISRVDQAKVSVLDRGFIFGDGIYEVVPVYGGRLFRFDEHMARLERSLVKVRIDNPHTREQWLAMCRQLVAALREQKGSEEQLVYIQITRGVAPRDHVMPPGLTPTVFMMASPMKPATPEQRHAGVACVSARDFRWERGDIKSISLLGNVMARQISADHGAVETIMFRDGWLTEAAACNVWIAHEGALLGPPKSEHVLEGIRVELLPRAVRGMRPGLQPAPDLRGRRARCRRSDAELGHQGSAAGHAHRWRTGRPRRAARQAGPGVRAAVRGLPAGQAHDVDLTRQDARHAVDIPPEQSLITYPSDFPIKVMGAAVEGFEEAVVAVALQFDPGFACRAHRAPAQQGRQLPGPDAHRHGHQPRAARRAVQRAEQPPDGEGGALTGQRASP